MRVAVLTRGSEVLAVCRDGRKRFAGPQDAESKARHIAVTQYELSPHALWCSHLESRPAGKAPFYSYTCGTFTVTEMEVC